VNAANLPALLAATGVKEVHFSARSPFESPMSYRLPNVTMGKAYTPEEYSRRVTRSELVRQVIEVGEKIAY
jgi:copper homeostasis protein CutC